VNLTQASIDRKFEESFALPRKKGATECSDRVAYCRHDYFKKTIKDKKNDGTFIGVWVMPDATPLKHQKLECQVSHVVFLA
jgi:hypothetical protein